MTSNRRNTIYLVILVVLICLNYFSNAEIIVRPSNTEALVGSSTFLNCSTSSQSEEIHWFYYAVGSTTDRTFVYGYDQFYRPFQDRFQIEKYGGLGNAYNLIITSVAVQDAGRYECQDNVGRGVKTSGELIVIGANPACTSNTETNEVIGPNSCGLTPTKLVLTCTVNYTGNEAPIMEIGPAGGSSITDERVSREVYDKRVTYKLTLKGDASLDGVSYKCQTRRSATTPYYCSHGPFTVPDNTSSESYVVAIIILSVLLAITICGLVTGVIYLLRFSRKGLYTQGKKNPSVEQDDVELQQLKNMSPEELISLHVLEVRMKDLEKRLYPTENIKYENEPRLVCTITPKTKEKPISGIAILGNELFITSSQSFDIEVYDSATFVFGRALTIGGLQDPLDITACSSNNCLYIAGRVDNYHTPETENIIENKIKTDDQRNLESKGTHEQAFEKKPSNEESSNRLFKTETQTNKTPLRKPESKSDAGIQPTIENQEKCGPEIEDKSDIETPHLPQAQDEPVTGTKKKSEKKLNEKKTNIFSKTKPENYQTKKGGSESKADPETQPIPKNEDKCESELPDKSETQPIFKAQDKLAETTPVSKSKTKHQQKKEKQTSKTKSKINQTNQDEPEIQPDSGTQSIPKEQNKCVPEIMENPESQPLMQTKYKPPTKTISGGKEKPTAETEDKLFSKAQPPTNPKPIPESHVAPTTKILKIDSKGTILFSWPMEGEHARLSTFESNVIVCLSDKQVINEYRADGILLKTVRLSPALGLNHPWQALKLTSMHFMICHGDKGDKLHQVCVVNLDGNIVKFCKEWETPIFTSTGTFEAPICIAEDSEKSIIVADRDNSRVLLFNSVLRFRKELIPKCLNGCPIRLCLNETVGLLYVGNNYGSCKTGWKNGRVLIFKVK